MSAEPITARPDSPPADWRRGDGRTPEALREVRFERGFTRYAEGSVLVSFGHTRVLCTASVLDKVPPFMRGRGTGWVTAEYGMLPRATHTRSDREAARGQQGGRTLEIQRLIGRSLRAVTNMSALGERTIQLDCDVLQADGGTRTAAITGAWVALRDAVDGLLATGAITEDPLTDSVAAVSVGLLGIGTTAEPMQVCLLDLEYGEDSRCDTDMNVVMTGTGGLVEIQGTAEGRPFTRLQTERMLDLAGQGIAQLVRLQQASLKPHG